MLPTPLRQYADLDEEILLAAAICLVNVGTSGSYILRDKANLPKRMYGVLMANSLVRVSPNKKRHYNCINLPKQRAEQLKDELRAYVSQARFTDIRIAWEIEHLTERHEEKNRFNYSYSHRR